MTTAEQPSFVLPMSTAVERYRVMQVEAILNTEYQVTENVTPLEHCLRTSKDAETTAALLSLPPEQHAQAVELLRRALSGGRIEEIYGLRGGILNILLPPTHVSLDAALGVVRSGGEGVSSLQQFANTANELFSSLTPGQVWAGTGKIEMQLADLILPQLWQQTREMGFPTPGAANAEWLSRMRLWSYNPSGGNFRGRIIDLIVAERDQNLRKRVEWALELKLAFDFEPIE